MYGPGQNLKNLRQGMVSIYLAQMLKERHIHVKGSGKRFRDFIYIDDVVDSFQACLSHPESAGHVINIATRVRTTVQELIDKLTQLYHKGVTYTYSGATPGDLFGIYADIGKAKKLLNFQPRYSLGIGLKKMLKWAIEDISYQ